MSPLTKSINTCCFTNKVDIIISVDIIVIVILVNLLILLFSNIDVINNILIEQCREGKQFKIGVSIQNIKCAIQVRIFVDATSGLATVVGYITNIILAITVHNIYPYIYLTNESLFFLYKIYGTINIKKY